MHASDRFDRHGFVRVSANHTHLEHADGTPFFFVADTAWNGALLSTDDEWNRYLDDRIAKGFTAIQYITHAPWAGAYTNLEGLTAFDRSLRAGINSSFFDRIERRTEQINRRGLLAVPVLAWAANFGESSRHNVGHWASASDLIPFIRYQVQRLAKYHVLWVLAGDGKYSFLRALKWKRVGRAVFGDQPHAPVTLHPQGLTWPYDAFRREHWLDVFGYQSSHSDRPETLHWLRAGPPATAWRRDPRPTINLEPVYEGISRGRGQAPFDRDAVRVALYTSLLNAPTAGVAYGAHGVWGWHATRSGALNHPGAGEGPPWHEAMGFEGSYDVRRLAELFTSIRWWTLRPNPALLNQVPPRRNPDRPVSVAHSEDGNLIVAYLPPGADGILDLAKQIHGMHGFWFNPRTGGRAPASPGSGGYTVPDQNDWLLVLTRARGS